MFIKFPQFLTQSVTDIISNLNYVNVIELVIIFVVIYKIYKYITGTQAEQLLKGILMLLFALLLSKIFRLEIIGRVLESIVSIVLFSLVVIFQPELRRILGYLGQPGIIRKNILSHEPEEDSKTVITEITEAIKHLSKSHTGALIVIQNVNGLESYLEVGTKLNATVSTELLLTIFHPNTPLHDGAVVISGGKILAASVLLPLTEDPKLSWQYGTRHRAAIGMSEASDAICLVVSEETGHISLAQGGNLTQFASSEELRKELEFLYGLTETEVAPESKKKFNINTVLGESFSKYPVFWSKKQGK